MSPRFVAILAFVLWLPALASSQELDCTDSQTQVEMTGCAARAHEAADRDLNIAFQKAMAEARRMDEYLSDGQIPAATLLRDAQRNWIAFRDAACDAESLMARGGTMQSMLFFICLERQTKRRTEDLQLFANPG